MRLLAFSLLSALACSACGDRFDRLKGGTILRLAPSQGNAQLAASPYNGDLMFYVVGVNGTPFVTTAAARTLSEAAGLSLAVPNGQYKVFALAWESSGSPNYYPVEGNTACGYGDGGTVYSLTGGSQTINLSMATANCGHGGNSVFSDGGYSLAGYGFGRISINLCNGLTSGVCTASNNSYGGFNMEFTLDGYTENNGVRTSLPNAGLSTFGCGFINTNNAASSKSVPVGSAVAGDPAIMAVTFAVHASADSSCTGARLATFSFPKGIINGLNGVSGKSALSYNATSPGSTTLYIDTL